MCGRFQRKSNRQLITEAFGLPTEDLPEEEEAWADPNLAPNYNAAPGTMQPVIVWDERRGLRTLRMMYWRFLPPFCTDPKKLKLDTIQASAERLLSSSMWRQSFLYRRCLIPADTFVEWRRIDAPGKRSATRQPYVFGMKTGEPFGIGAIWQHWRSQDGTTEFDTFAVVTVEPNELVNETTQHDRMPLLIPRRNYERWLREDIPNRPPTDLLRPYDSSLMTTWRVGTAINNVRNNDPSLIEPSTEAEPEAEPEPAPTQLSMFG